MYSKDISLMWLNALSEHLAILSEHQPILNTCDLERGQQNLGEGGSTVGQAIPRDVTVP